MTTATAIWPTADELEPVLHLAREEGESDAS